MEEILKKHIEEARRKPPINGQAYEKFEGWVKQKI